jgi:hypothetical protein
MQILGTHLATENAWATVQSDIFATFLPPRVKERFLMSYVTDRFQAPGEDLNDYIMSVVAAAAILGFTGTEQQLVRRMVQNKQPKLKAYCLFENRPETVQELYSLANQRERQTAPAPRTVPPPGATTQAAERLDRRIKCWQCRGWGHVARRCSVGVNRDDNPAPSGNAGGARQ